MHSGRGNTLGSPSSHRKKKLAGTQQATIQGSKLCVSEGRERERHMKPGWSWKLRQSWRAAERRGSRVCAGPSWMWERLDGCRRVAQGSAEQVQGTNGPRHRRRQCQDHTDLLKGFLFLIACDVSIFLYRCGLTESSNEHTCSVFCTHCQQL